MLRILKNRLFQKGQKVSQDRKCPKTETVPEQNLCQARKCQRIECGHTVKCPRTESVQEQKVSKDKYVQKQKVYTSTESIPGQKVIQDRKCSRPESDDPTECLSTESRLVDSDF